MSKVEITASKIEKLGEVILVPISFIRPFPDQPRKYFDQQKLIELAESISAVGQKVPGFVKEISGNHCPEKYELIDGQRRWHALTMAGKDSMKVIVIEVKSVEEQFLISVVANFGRAEHGPLEIATAIQRFRDNDVSVIEIAKIFAKSVPWVYQHIKILRLDPEVREMMSSEIPEDRRLAFSTALLLADIPLDLQKKIADTIVKDKLKLNQARNLIRRRAEKIGFKVGNPRRSPRDDYLVLCSFIGRMRRELEIFKEMQQSYFDKMFQFRDKEDHERIVEKIQEITDRIKSFLITIKRAEKK
jgi:ParB family chromosome partitioning protein